MGNRRLGRKRLYSVNKQGQSDTVTAGANAPSVTKQNTRREGSRIVTEIAVDLGGNTSVVAATDGDIIGKSGATGVYIAELSLANHGYITYAELACLEAPGTASADINVVVGDAADDAEDAAVTNAEVLLAPGGNLTLGARLGMDVSSVFDGDTETKKYLYLTNGVSSGDGTYSAGKLLITLEGVASDAVPDA
jgi:hypothetical protein